MAMLPVARGIWRESAVLGPLQIRDFRLFWSGNLVSQCGDQFQIVALAILALNLTHNPATLGGENAAQAIPRALFMLVGGIITDRFRASGVLRVTNLLMAFLVGILATLTAVRMLDLWHLYVYAVLAGSVYAFSVPAQQSIASELVPLDKVRHAVALNTTGFNTALFLVPPIAGVLVAQVGSAPAFALNAFSFGVAATCLWFVRGGAPREEARKSDPLGQLREGVQLVVRSPLLRVAVFTLTIYSLGYRGPNLVGVPTLAKLTLGAGDPGVGLLYGIGGAGALLAALGLGVNRAGVAAGLAGRAHPPRHRRRSHVRWPRDHHPSRRRRALPRHCSARALRDHLSDSGADARSGRGARAVMAFVMLGVVGLKPLSLSLGGCSACWSGGGASSWSAGLSSRSRASWRWPIAPFARRPGRRVATPRAATA